MTYMTLAAKYRTSAAGRAAMQEKDLIPALVNWYDKVLKNDVLSEIVKEVNEELEDEDDVRYIAGLATMPASRKTMISELALSDLMSPIVPYDAAGEEYSLADLRRALRMGGMIDEGDSKDDLVTAIMDKLPGPMFSSEDFPEGDQQRAARGAEAAFDFTPYLDAGGSPKRPREDEGALAGTLGVDAGVYDSSLAGMLAPKPGTFTRNRDAFMDAPRTEGFIHKGVQWGGECAGCGEVGHQFSECMRDVTLGI